MPSIRSPSARTKASNSAPSMPSSRLPGRRYQGASARVSTSPKRSTTITSTPARLAACASARPESARIRIGIGGPSGARDELASRGKRLAEIDELGLVALVQTAQQFPLQAELHVADRQRADADGGLTDGDAIRHSGHPFHPRARDPLRLA